MPSYGSNSRKRYKLRLLSMGLEKEGVLKVVPPRRGQMAYFGEGFAWGQEVRGNNTKRTSSRF